MEGDKLGTYEDLIAMTPDRLRPVTARLRDLILAVDPDPCMIVRLGERAATFGVGPKKMSEGYAHILPYKDWVNLGFYRGSELDDPENLLAGTGAKMRHVKCRTLEECDRPAIIDLIRCALNERKNALGRG